MNKTRKVDLLYKKAKGQNVDASPQEMMELRKYKVSANEGSFYATKAYIREYVDAVDQHKCRTSFYDWCMNNNKADRRRRGSSEKEMSSMNRSQGMAVMFWGWLIWGMVVYWALNGSESVGFCAIVGAVISLVLYRMAREWAGVTLFLLPAVLLYFIAKK